MRRLLIGDRKVRLRDEGESDKAPLVLLHGAGASSVVWIDVVRRLAGRRRVIAPDLPGHGQSDPWHDVATQHRLELYRDAVGTICAQLELKRVVLVGHSMGAAIALLSALAWPERVAGLVLVGGGARMRVAPTVIAALAAAPAEQAELVAAAAYSPSTAKEVVERWRAVLVQAPPELVIADFQACDGFDVRPRLQEVKLPALAITGSDDVLMPPKLGRELAAGLANGRAVIVPHTGHMPFHEQPDRFHQALDPFLVEVP